MRVSLLAFVPVPVHSVEGIELLNGIQDVRLSKDVTIT